MARFTKIQWCDSTANPVQGCGGCELRNAVASMCYAGALTDRYGKSNPGFADQFERPELKPGKMAEAARWPDLSDKARNRVLKADGRVSREAKPWLSGLPRHIFVSDMGDALTEKGFAHFNGKPVTNKTLFRFLREEVIDVVTSPNGLRHQWLWLTKRPQRLHAFADYAIGQETWPANLWVGTSVTNKASLSRIDSLCKFRGKEVTKFISAEPLWEQVSLEKHLRRLHWLIIGGESGRKRKSAPFDCTWAESLIEECQGADVPVFVKQIGGNPLHHGDAIDVSSSHGDVMSEWPKSIRLRQMPVSRVRYPQSC
ncbi:DUF5131 family protein [Roseiconus lacunae]|uniref:DUF5131 family protein n=1 Tax=Roseiconus lacunae TaxID=2605694 RepID=UPI001E5EF6F3|nr:DUF5131 family protein [Roseiconus lacunae]MCD0462173.1 phage Gp37/Gp68 family protein [Roseiconus lacunae]